MINERSSEGKFGRSLWLIPVVLLVGNLVTVLWQILEGAWQDKLNDVSFNIIGIAFAAVGTLIIARKPKQVIGWLLMGFPLLVITDAIALNYLAAHPPTPEPELLTLLVGWYASSDWWLLIGPLLLILQLFPTGKPISHRWRWPGRVLLVTFIYFVIFLTLGFDIEIESLDFVYPTPFHTLPANLTDIGFVIFGGALLSTVALSAASVIVRYRRGDQTERAQLRWLMLAAAFFFVIYTYGFITEVWNSSAPLNVLLFTSSLLLIPIAIGIAILQYHLWDINVVINRTLVYGALTATLVALFGGAVFVLSRLSIGGGSANIIAGMAAMGAFGLVFQPLRRGLQRFIDRRFYHIEIDYQMAHGADHFFSAAASDKRFSQYTNLQLIGRGGMAEVYRALPQDGGEPVAIKVLPADMAQDPDYRKRFDRELMVMRTLEHPNIVRVLDYGEENNLAYIAMEFINGVDLAEHLNRVGYLPPDQALKILKGICEALEFAHNKGLVHRDIKPSNIMLDEKGEMLRPVLMDFGIAKILGLSVMTGSAFLGTLDYISPEQIQGQEDINAQADIYSLGVMTYQMLAGQMPFQRKNPGALLLAHLTQPAPDIREVRPDVPASIAQNLMVAMSKRPDERHRSALEFLSAISLN